MGKTATSLPNWAKQVRKRDRGCQRCSNRRKLPIHAHHIKPQAFFPDLKLDVSNGVALCAKCHTQVHRNVNNALDFAIRHRDSTARPNTRKKQPRIRRERNRPTRKERKKTKQAHRMEDEMDREYRSIVGVM